MRVIVMRLVKRYLWVPVSVVVLISLYFLLVTDLNTLQYREYRKNLRLGHTSGQNKHILLWTSFFESESWYLGRKFLEKTYFEEIGCDVTTCVVTSHRDLLESIAHYDAVLFHAGVPWNELGQIPQVRAVHQSYVMAILESPIHTRHDLKGDNGFYNLTMTYRLDSDVVWPYAVFEDQITGQVVSPSDSPQWRTVDEAFSDQNMLEAVSRKSKMAAWFVSHCNVNSRRDDLVRAMQQNIDVDVYGRCGSLSCPRSADCGAMLDADYKFYFSFENSLCDDYVTEKLFNTMKRHIIPVVYGGANYSKFVPPRSYINANDFEDVKQLTDYLVYLAQHPEEYVKYFWWKKWYRVRDSTPFCDLCKKLHDMDYSFDERHVNEDVDGWWHKGRCEHQPDIKF